MATNKSEQSSSLCAPWRVGIDVGGTFTDMVLGDAEGALRVFKVLSTPGDPAIGVLNVIEAAAEALSISVEEFLSSCALFVHGSTVATNTMLEGKGAIVGMLTTAGFRDSLEIRRSLRDLQWDHRTPYPEVLVPRYLRRPVRGRIDRDSRETAPLEIADVTLAAEHFKADNVEAVAVCLLNSYLNPDHEQACASALAKAGFSDWVSTSSDVLPIMGEYERSSTTVINAYLAPVVVSYLETLNGQLQSLGLTRSMLLVQSNGGAVSVDRIAARPVNLVLSGPAAGVGALSHYAQSAGTDNLISMEIGGTSCDVMLMGDGRVEVDDQLTIAGYHVATPSVDIHTVGAGGGTIAGVDSAGMIFMGPKGAGAFPGPACYGQGGEEPTSTDAQLVLGRLRAGSYADGSVSLDDSAARAAIDQKVATPLGITCEAAAIGMIRLLEQNLLNAVEQISIQRGHNPERFTLIACGGAGPMHGASVGRALGCSKVYVPRQAGVFCALGMLHSDVRQDFLRVHHDNLDAADHVTIEQLFTNMESQARDALTAEGFGPETSEIERWIDLRYRSQQWSIRIPVNQDDFDPDTIRKAFEVEHDRLYGHIQPEGSIYITAVRCIGWGRLAPLATARRATSDTSPSPFETRQVFLSETDGWRDIPIYRGEDLRPGHTLSGPFLIEEATTTVFVGPEDRLEVDTANNYQIQL